jgi:hypothetical protein
MKKKETPDPALLTIIEALDLLNIHIESGKKKVHTLSGNGFLMGCDYTLSSIKKHLKETKHICLSGPNMRGMGHGVAFLESKSGYTFLETDKKKLDAIRLERKIKD